ncbi:hypothetical protein PG991_001742 [Apiospora marii]|uniref:Uncharacterized protein n=1 Tax=Apiospora marii TaxID=335849 RepID=A0ABR1SS94_9PEZI
MQSTVKSADLFLPRVTAVRSDEIPNFFRQLKSIRERKNIKPANDANMDDAGVQGETQKSHVIGTSRTNRVY